MLPVVYKGDDITIPIRVKQNGNYIDLNSTFANVVVAVYTDRNNALIYGREQGSTYLIDVVDPTLYLIRIPSFISANMSEGIVTLEIKFIKEDPTLDDGYFDETYRVELLTLKDTVLGAFTGIPINLTVQGDDYNQIEEITLTNINPSITILYWKFYESVFMISTTSDFKKIVAKTDKINSPGTYIINPDNNSGITGSIKISYVYKLTWKSNETQNGYVQIYLLKGNTTVALIEKANTDADNIDIYSNIVKTTIGKLSQRVKCRLYFSVEPYLSSNRIKFFKNVNDTNYVFEAYCNVGTNIKSDITKSGGGKCGEITLSTSSTFSYAKNANTYIEYYDGSFTVVGKPSQITSMSLFFELKYMNSLFCQTFINNINPTNNILIENTIKPAVVNGDTHGLIKQIQFTVINNDIAEGLKEDDGTIIIS